MNRSFTVFTALLCSVSMIPLATAAPNTKGAPLTDWHVAPVLAGGPHTSPYCAMAANYPAAGIIITHARNKNGAGTVAFDFKNAAFDAHQYYGLDIQFGATTTTFAAEAKNSHLLVIELRNDHPLYAALDAGQNIDINVQQGGPHLAVAGNSRAFFQLNYCVEALNDEPAGDIVAEAMSKPNPSFGLQQPALPQDTLNKVAKNLAHIEPQASSTSSTLLAQAETTQSDAGNAELSKMLDAARADKTTPKRQKLSGISSNDIVDTNSAAPLNNNAARKSLLYDDPSTIGTYMTPHIGDVDSGSLDTNAKAAAKAPVRSEAAKAAALAKPEVKADPKPAPIAAAKPAPVAKLEPVKPAALPPSVSAPAVSAPAIAVPAAAALPPPKDSLSDLDEPVVAAPKPKTGILSDTERSVLATDYIKGMTSPAPIAAKPSVVVPAPASKSVPVLAAPVASETKPAITKPTVAKAPEIVWDQPTTDALAPKSASIPAPASAPALALDKPIAPVAPAADIKASLSDAPASAMTTVKPAPTIAAPAAKTVLPTTTGLQVGDVIAKAEKPTAVAPKMPADSMAMAPVMPAPAMPPAIVEEMVMENTVRGPMKRADEAVHMAFPEEDNGDDVSNAAAYGLVPTTDGNKPLVAPDALMQKAKVNPMLPVTFKPPAALNATPWEAKRMTPKNGALAYCVLQSRFVNQQNLFLSRAADGSATLGLDYGMDLLQRNETYQVTVQIDNRFAEDFIAQAREPNLLVVQMGLKDSLFAAASQGKALHIEMAGGASTFDITGINSQMNAFNTCLTTQGGTAVNMATGNDLAAISAPVENAAAQPGAAPASISLSAPQVGTVLQKANIPANGIRPTSNGYQWGSRMDVVQGEMAERRFLIDKTDLLEAAMRDLDSQEQSCTPAKFTSEIGAPEQSGAMESVTAETSCTANSKTTVTASLYQRIGQIFRIWTQRGPDSSRDLLLRQRNRLSAILAEPVSTETNNNKR